MKTILILSPHLDDAVLSCGGMMAEAVSRGVPIVVYDLFCAPYNGPLSPAAQQLHASWGSPQDITALRIDEDRQALDHLGVQRILGDQCDLIYRQDANGDWLYTQIDDIMGERRSEDDALVDHYAHKVSTLFGPDEVSIFAPLGIGGHIDHLIAYDAGVALYESGYDVAFYEDLPYALKDVWRDARLRELDGMESEIEYFSLASLAKKLEALELYASQIAELFGNVGKMREWLTGWALRMSRREDMGGEMVWRFKPQMKTDIHR